LARLKRWWSRKYNRPPNDPMFVSQTEPELRLEMFEDLLVQREEILDKLEEAGDLRERADLHERLQEINKVFDYKTDMGEDDLIDEWERDLEEGRVPDLSKTTVG
jgi:hypothetical protein